MIFPLLQIHGRMGFCRGSNYKFSKIIQSIVTEAVTMVTIVTVVTVVTVPPVIKL